MVSESGEVRRQVKSCTDHLKLIQPPVQENLSCPRCQSTSTKFCYYNNYNMSQPRYFCKACRRYWTHGGTLRNIPIGGGTRKTPAAKRPRTSTPSPTSSSCSSLTHHHHHHPTTADSVLNLNNGFSGFLQLGGYDEMGHGLGMGVNGSIWAFPDMGHNGGGVGGDHTVVDGGRSMTFPMSGHVADGGWNVGEVECNYGWPNF